ncbi:MAG: histidine kinase [Bacteroidota bacterium]
MRHCLLIICLFLAPLSAICQYQRQIDSLYQVLPTATDTHLVDVCAYLSKNYSYLGGGADLDSAFFYARKGLALARELEYIRGIERNLFTLGILHSHKREPRKSNEAFLEALPLLELTENKKGIALAYNNMGRNRLMVYDNEGALEYFLIGLRMSEEEKDTTDIATGYNNIAIIYHRMGDMEASLASYKKSIWLAEQINDELSLVYCYTNIASDYQELGHLDSARMATEKCLALGLKFGMKEAIIRAYNQLANFGHREREFDKTFAYTDSVFAWADEEAFGLQLGRAHHHRGAAYDSLGRPADALPEAERALYFAEKAHSMRSKANALSLLKSVHFGLGNYEQSMQYADSCILYQDSLFRRDTDQRLEEMKTRFETEKKDQEIAELASLTRIQQLELNQKNLVMVGLLGAAILLTLLIGLFLRQRMLKERQKAMDAEQRLLRTQMNPHFLFNALSSIQTHLYETEDPILSAQYMAKFAKLMRLILMNSRTAYITLEQEIRTLRLYLDLQKVRFGDSFDYFIELDEDLDPEEVMIPPMFAQPFIENSLEHGFVEMQEKGEIRLRFQKKEDMLDFSVEDNGIGVRQAARRARAKAHSSMATKIAQDRIALLKKMIRRQMDLRITDLQETDERRHGTRVTLLLPLLHPTQFS